MNPRNQSIQSSCSVQGAHVVASAAKPRQRSDLYPMVSLTLFSLSVLLLQLAGSAEAGTSSYHRVPFSIVAASTYRSPPTFVTLIPRGGHLDEYDDDDEYDVDEYDEDEEEENDTEKIDHSILDLPPPDAHKQRRRPPPSRHAPPAQRPIRKKKKGPHWSQKLATQSIQMTGNLAWNTLVKQPSKLAYHVIRPKYVRIQETDGLWRLEQQVTERGDKVVASVATIELQARPQVVVIRQQQGDSKDDVKIIKEPYTFTKKKMSGSFQTQFVAPAFLIGENQMRLYGYRGTWQRKLADKKVIKLVGKIYQVHKQRFGKQRGEYVFGQSVGTFVARRKIRAHVDDEEEDYDDDGYDEEEDMDEYDEEEWEEFDPEDES